VSANIPVLLRALTFAPEKHRDQRRKDAGASPYINHPIAVASLLAVEGGVTDETTILAALLHDTVEDTQTTFLELEALFGVAVAALVREVTDDKSLAKEKRKELQVAHAPTASSSAKRLKIADKICNIRDVTHNPPSTWSVARRRQYLDWAEQVVVGCRGADPPLEAPVRRSFARWSQSTQR
jgi:GTP diphosphokinase / guanosine-3',5'-bis(diphosphate) 3'-diphosphatase